MKLLWISFVLGTISVLTILTGLPARLWVFVLIFIGVIFGIWAWVVVQIGRGRNWARIFYLALVFLGVLMTLYQWRTDVATYATQPIAAVLALTQTILQFAAAYFLITVPTRTWFRQQRARSDSSRRTSAGASAPPSESSLGQG
jgi:hypothetical protein